MPPLATTSAPSRRQSPARTALVRRLSYIMLVRVVVYTLLLGGTVALNLAWGTPEELGGPFVTVLFVFISVIYLVNIIYAVMLRLLSNLRAMGAIQIGIDLVTTTVLVHFTGGADSAFVLFFLLSPIAAPIILGRRAALITAAVGTLLLGTVAALGWARVLPVLPGQLHLPWGIPPTVAIRSLLFHGAAMFAMAILAGYLAEQLRTAAARVEAQQAQIDDLEATIKRSEHLAAIGRLAAGVAHEIRNPLASISGSIELLREEQGLPPDSRRLMGIALREIERLDTMIADLLNFARPKPPALEPLNIGRGLRALVGQIEGLMRSDDGPALTVVELDEDVWINADRDLLSGVLWNLISNAWQAGESDQVLLSVGADGQQGVRVTVEDHGQGIQADDLPHIFEPFFTTRTRGNGLGLSIVQRVVESHGGSIAVRSTVGVGTSFEITLPRVRPPR